MQPEFPQLPSHTPLLIAKLVDQMLDKNPSKRLSATQVANICQLMLWAPSSWTNITNQRSKKSSIFSKKYTRSQSKSDSVLEERTTHDILQWLLTLTTKIIYEARFPKTFTENENKNIKERSNYEYQLVATFLSRIQMDEIKSALNWIQRNY